MKNPRCGCSMSHLSAAEKDGARAERQRIRREQSDAVKTLRLAAMNDLEIKAVEIVEAATRAPKRSLRPGKGA